jgi:hypothetical protein
MILIPFSIEKCTFSMAIPSDSLSCNSYFDTVTSEPALYKLSIFHVANLVSMLCCLGCLSKESFKVLGSYKWFTTCLICMVRGCQPHAKPHSWRTTPCCLPSAVYSVYSQPPSTAGSSFLHLQPVDVPLMS